MKNLRQLGLILSVGTLAALVITGCSDDATPTGGTAGSSGSGTSGSSGSGTGGTAGSGTSGSTATGGGGSSATGGGGAATGGGGAATGGGGAAAGGGGAATGGGGAATGGGGAGGSGGSGGAPSADCTKWCSGDNGVVKFCMGSGLADNVNTEQKCIAHCTATEASGAMGLACWNTHLQNAINNKDNAEQKKLHCGHASGAPSPANGPCNETK